ncbi:pyridoxamine 5'-phosphate oxidase family protein [Phaeobacter sp. HF9A]|uniref:pyridoxamine 5'-phosphate oxidase family protein n=1 Tax=Phaeobacter sp. HF9A TaxID=2721561 RepID=UPI00143034C2|nr:pyridoxamine 5'-phosphate oxidase family protein [Phaeobacter sp. HF9A]NIZ14018.1 pyridoxamine 5'-phosphate oxidase [Phaeobacter sp. HF9A]
MTRPDPAFHAGERAVQDRAGVPEDWRQRAARAIRPDMSAQHQAFFESLPLLFVGLRDGQGRPWATICPLPDGAQATRERLSARSRPLLADRLDLDLRPGSKVAVLGLDFATRRRNRMNGVITETAAERMTIQVEQSYGNCPQYISPREMRPAAAPLPAPEGQPVAIQDAVARRILSTADTFFIASSATSGMDVSHRGGRAGLLRQREDGRLSFPDYPGNRYFNTLGNIEISGRAGLFIPEFASGEALLLTGRAVIDWSPARAARYEGAERMLDIHPEEVWHVRHALPRTRFAAE